MLPFLLKTPALQTEKPAQAKEELETPASFYFCHNHLVRRDVQPGQLPAL
jgi:hypothetical protein